MKKIIYLHGYGSSNKSIKSIELKQYFDVLCPNIPIKYDEAFKFLTIYLKDKTDYILVGTSLGGYWAGVMSELFHIPAVLINPSCDPQSTLINYKNENLDEIELSKYKSLSLTNAIPRIVLLAKDDNIIDYKIAETRLSPISDVKLFDTGGHRFNDINKISFYINELSNTTFYIP